MALEQAVRLEVEGAPEALRVSRVHVEERMHGPWRCEVICVPHGAGEEPAAMVGDDLLGKPALVAWQLPDGEERVLEGLVESVGTTARATLLTIVPRLALLADCVDHVVFLDQDAVEIATAVLAEHGVTLEARMRRTPAKRAQCVQAFESDLDFVRRILAEEGATLWIPLGQKDAVVASDNPSGFDDVPGIESLPFREDGGMVVTESVHQLSLRRSMVHDKQSLRDYFFENPALDLATSAGDAGKMERYEYPGAYSDPGLGAELAGIRLDAAQARTQVLEGTTTCRRLSAGHVVELTGAPIDAIDGRWLLLSVAHHLLDQDAADDASRYEARFTAVPAATRYRPTRPGTPRNGLQTATVTAPSGSEIHTEELGRSKVHLRWDRRRPMDDTSSAWARVMQPATSGSMLLPRTGWETVLCFQHGNADAPWLLGRVYNGAAPPPDGLPGKKTSSAFGSLTTPGGGSANIVSMDDTAGNEGVAFTASKDFNERTENDKATEVKADDTATVGANRTLIVGKVHQLAVTGSQTYSVGSNRTVNADANMLVEAGSESILIGGLRVLDIGGDLSSSSASLTRLVGAAKVEAAIEHQMRTVTGASTVVVGGSFNEVGVLSAAVKVGGASTETVAGAKTLNAGKYELKVRGALAETLASHKVSAAKISEDITGPMTMTVGASMKAKGADVTFKATGGKLTIKASGITIEMSNGSVKVDGKFDGSVKSVDEGDQSYE